MAEEEIKATAELLDYSILERRRKCRQELELKKECRREFLLRKGKSIRKKEEEEKESLLRITLLKAANEHREKIRDHEDSDPAIGLSIGGYSRFTGKDVTVRSCFVYKMRELHWEIVEGPLRRILVVRWVDIAGLDLKLNECGLACLTVEVNSPPDFMMYDPESKSLSYVENFTDDDDIKLNLPPHHVVFEPGIVDESYEALLNYRKEEEVLNEKHYQWYSKKMLRREKKQAKLREKHHQFLQKK